MIYTRMIYIIATPLTIRKYANTTAQSRNSSSATPLNTHTTIRKLITVVGMAFLNPI